VLHFLEQGRFWRVGSTRDQTADVRILTEVERQRFRADLYYRHHERFIGNCASTKARSALQVWQLRGFAAKVGEADE
jgi:hypothetical protein